ncbi:type II secretion system protein [Halorubrum sp. Atlit-8R]|uniref:type II/IV secretion system ATPase subunit n=1 Tax=unclassified Halorubrum TaxID=2642239 RepID=UPI000EF28539|nr:MULTISPECIES: type II/IV secretion system ATPase subunit [unclassified Halorubrum]RLM71018.1 type II secretion system protein [Halorubrum sp. Atlit-9R]RLM71886.1 type II secretion system protein [Halorubrum sp. Atlit-9R]RLM82829.1 type II secretion system protein [Halorubrum sp. Atlit-8R]
MASDAGGSDLGDRIEDLQRRLSHAWELIQGSTLDVRPFRPGEDGPLASFVVPEDEREVDRYWVNAPYAYVVITYDEAESEHRYYAVEPELDAFERDLLDRVVDDIRDPLLYREGTGKTDEETLRSELESLLEGYGVEVGMDSFHALAYYLYRDFRGYGKVDPLLNDRHIEDVSCDGYDLPIFVYHDEYTDIETNVSFGQEALDSYVIRLAQQSGRHVSVGDPIVETTLPDGSRAELALGEEVTPRGSAFTIRQYAEDPFTPVDLVEYGTFSIEQMAYFWLCIEHNKSLIFAGGTASGKTTSMNAVSMFVPPRAKVLTIEDTRELSLYHDNWLSAVTRERRYEGTDIDMYDLLRSALRHRPEYIVVGEVRGEEAITLFQAMNTGHTTFSTMHADSIETVINRLENEPINVPRAMVQSLDMLSVQTLTRSEDERVRRAKTIGEIGGIDQRTGELDYSSAFEWVPDADTFRRNDSSLLEEIADERGWSRSELLREVRRRERFLELLSALGIDDYRTFTALVNEYYADPDRVMERLDDRAAAADGVDADELAAEEGRAAGDPTADPADG